MAQDGYLCNPLYIGYIARDPSNSGLTNLPMDTANMRLAIGFTVPSNKTLSSFMLYCDTATGTMTAANEPAAIQATTAGAPSGTDLESRPAGAIPTSSTWVNWTGFTQALTANTQYWIVLRNNQGTPASNFPTWRFISRQGLPIDQPNGAGAFWEYLVRYSSDGGSSYGSGGNSYVPAAGFRIGFSDGSYIGLPIQNIQNVDSTDTVYSTREYGWMFTYPSTYPTINVSRMGMFLSTGGTAPSGGLRMRLYTGSSPSLAGTTATIPVDSVKNTSWHWANFTSPIAIAPNTIVRAVFGAVSGGSSGNDFRTYPITIENSSASKGLTPFGSLQKTYYNGSAWTETDTLMGAFALQLDATTPFTLSGGGGLLTHPGMSGRCNG